MRMELSTIVITLNVNNNIYIKLQFKLSQVCTLIQYVLMYK
jgi:hypothetical protein